MAIPVASAGDLVLRDDFARLVAALSRDCSDKSALRSASPAEIAALAGRGGLAPRDSFMPRDDVRSEIAPWLLALAIVTAIAEMFVRRHRSLVVSERRNAPMERAA